MDRRLNWRHLFAWACLALSVIGQMASVEAATLDESVQGAAQKIASYLRSKGEKSLSIGQFTGPPQLGATSGPSIAQLFNDHLGKHEILVERRSNVGLQGAFVLVDAPDEGVAVRLNCSLVDRTGEVLTDFVLNADTVDRQEDVATLLGTTAHLFSEDRLDDRNRDFKKRVFSPELAVDGARARADRQSPYAIEIAVEHRPVPVEIHDGQGFVRLGRGDLYTVRLYNDSDLEAAVRLSIDGLNVFTFSEIRDPTSGKPKYAVYIIPPHSHVELRGWHRTNESVDSFLVTDYAGSAAATIKHQEKIGSITAIFSAAWPKGGRPPEDENLTARSASGGNATGFGPPIKQVAHEVEREVGRMRAAITIRYDK